MDISVLLLTEVERGEEHREAEDHGGDVLLAAAAHSPALGQDLVEHHVEDGARGQPWVQTRSVLQCPDNIMSPHPAVSARAAPPPPAPRSWRRPR